MPKPEFQRARKPEQKQQRRDDIIAATAALFEQHGFEGVSLNAIAREAGLAKSNVYRYFGGREEIFLALVAVDYDDYVAAVGEALAPLSGSDDVTAVGTAIAKTAAARPRLCALTAVLSSVIEQNISEEAFVAFKTQVVAVSDRIASVLRDALPSIGEPAAYEFQRYLQALAAGLWPMAQTSDKFDHVMARPEFGNFCVAFEQDLVASVVAVLGGLVTRP